MIAAIFITGTLAASAYATNKRPNGEVITTCHSVTFVFTGFPNLPNNTVREKVFVYGSLFYEGNFSFNGPTGSNTIPVTGAPAGTGIIDGRASWNTNGFQGGYDVGTGVNCSEPAFTIEKEQEIEGSGAGFTKSTLLAGPGKTILYRIKVTDTGNTTLTFGPLTDTHCTGITGGPTGPLSPGESATYTCSHLLTVKDEEKGAETYENSATVTANPPKGEGGTVKHTSNIVIVKFPSPHERPNGEVGATCNSITFTYRKFPNLPNNTVTEKVFVHGVLILTKLFHFNGPEGSDTISITVPPGTGTVDGRAKWDTNGFSGGWDIAIAIKCNPAPSFSIEKLQKIDGSNGPFTTTPVTGSVGGKIDYEIIVKNTGNVPLAFSNFTDANCSGIAGGPSGEVPIESSTTYTCSHTLTLADANHEYENSATVTATPPGEAPITHTSNTVVAQVPFTAKPGFTVTKSQHVAGQENGFTTGQVVTERRDTIEYEVVVRNTGNVPLTFTNFTDSLCDEGTIAGGPGVSAVEPETSTTYTCTHLVTWADEKAGTIVNTAEDTGTPPAGFGSAATHASNSVEAEILFVPQPGLRLFKAQRTGGEGPYTEGPITVGRDAKIEYEIVVKDEGNTELVLSEFSDPVCEPGTIETTGEPVLLPGGTRTYTCSVQLYEAAVGSKIRNAASAKGTPPEGFGEAQEATSNTAEAEVVED